MQLPSFVKQSESLQSYNTFGVKAVAQYFIKASNIVEMKQGIAWANEEGISPLILGGGSNVLFTKAIYPLVILNAIKGIEVIDEDDERVAVKSGAGVIWHDLVMHCIDNDWGGIENLSLIPGTAGAAPMQNIGAYGVEIKSVFESLEAMDLSTLEIIKFTNTACEFGYRESVFKKALKGKYVILSVSFKLTKKHKVNIDYGAIQSVLKAKNITRPTIQQVSAAVISIRQSKLPDPSKIGNAGSFFKNPVIPNNWFKPIHEMYPNAPHYPDADGHVKVPAGWMIEQCGWKGRSVGNVGVHHQQALVLVNHGGGTGDEILKLSRHIQKDVVDKFGISIESEVNVI